MHQERAHRRSAARRVAGRNPHLRGERVFTFDVTGSSVRRTEPAQQVWHGTAEVEIDPHGVNERATAGSGLP